MKNLGDNEFMTWDDTFQFECHSGVDCFNSCCKDITILLTPMDVVRMRTALGISSTDFLETYAHVLINRESGLPAIAVKMSKDESKKCPFVTEAGCSIYEARPYSCRMYPLDTDQGVEYKVAIDPEICHGLKETHEWTVEQWRQKQKLYEYDDLDHNLKDVMAADRLWEAKIQDPRMQDMVLMSLYDPDRFREFVLTSSFLKKFNIDQDIVEKISEDDITLLYFASQWLRFALFGEKGFLKIDREYLEAKKREVLGQRTGK
jgi:uncharacterized protein